MTLNQPLEILIVEDVPTQRLLLEVIIDDIDSSIEVTSAASAEEANDIIDSRKTPFHRAIIDLVLNGEHDLGLSAEQKKGESFDAYQGFNVAESLQAKSKDTKIYFITASIIYQENEQLISAIKKHIEKEFPDAKFASKDTQLHDYGDKFKSTIEEWLREKIS